MPSVVRLAEMTHGKTLYGAVLHIMTYRNLHGLSVALPVRADGEVGRHAFYAFPLAGTFKSAPFFIPTALRPGCLQD